MQILWSIKMIALVENQLHYTVSPTCLIRHCFHFLRICSKTFLYAFINCSSSSFCLLCLHSVPNKGDFGDFRSVNRSRREAAEQCNSPGKGRPLGYLSCASCGQSLSKTHKRNNCAFLPSWEIALQNDNRIGSPCVIMKRFEIYRKFA